MAFWVRDRSFYRTLMVLAIPIILQNVITHGVSLADNMMVGRLGEVPIAGLYLGNRIQTVLQILLIGVDSAIIILASQYWGKRDTERIKDVLAVSMRLALGFTTVVTLVTVVFPEWVMGWFTRDPEVVACGASYVRVVGVSYVFFSASLMLIGAMRAVEMVRIGLINSLVALVVNVGGNYVLIFGKLGAPAMGVRGAALATVVSRMLECAVVLFFVLRVDRNLRMRPRDFLRWNKEILQDLVRYGAPLMGGQVVWATNMFMRTVVVGAMDKPSMAAISIADMYDGMLCIGVFGLASAVGVLTGKAIGQGDVERVKTQARTMQVVFMGLGVILGCVSYSCRGWFLNFYSLEPTTLNIANGIMLVLAVAMVGRCYQAPCLMGLVKAGGDTSFVFKNDTVFVFLVVLPSALYAQFVAQAPSWVVYACLLSDQIFKCFVAVIKINSFNWIRDLTR